MFLKNFIKIYQEEFNLNYIFCILTLFSQKVELKSKFTLNNLLIPIYGDGFQTATLYI